MMWKEQNNLQNGKLQGKRQQIENIARILFR